MEKSKCKAKAAALLMALVILFIPFGSVFAAYLRRGGAELTLVDRYKAHMDICRERGLLFVTPEGEELLTGFHTAESAKNLEIQDFVILMVKATQTEALIDDLRGCVGPKTAVVSLQNGLGNDELLCRYFPPEQILYGFGTIGTELPEPGKCVSKPESGTFIRFLEVSAFMPLYSDCKSLFPCQHFLRKHRVTDACQNSIARLRLTLAETQIQVPADLRMPGASIFVPAREP